MRHAFRGRDYLAIKDFTKEEMTFLLEVSFDLKRRWAYGDSMDMLKGKTWGMIF